MNDTYILLALELAKMKPWNDLKNSSYRQIGDISLPNLNVEPKDGENKKR